jgi:hypothetical protein
MLSFGEHLMDWAEAWASAHREAPSVRVTRAEINSVWRSAWVEFESVNNIGQITVWESGDCELEVYKFDTAEAVLLEHREFSDLVGLQDAIQTVLAAFEVS